MEREYSKNLKAIVRGLKEINHPQKSLNYMLGQKVLLVIKGQGKKVTGGRMPFKLRQGSVESKCATRKRKGEAYGPGCSSLRLRVTHTGEENSELVKKATARGANYLYENIEAAYEVK